MALKNKPMKIPQTIIFAAIVGLITSACSKNSEEEMLAVGELQLNLNQNTENILITGVKTTLNTDDFKVIIEDDQGAEVKSYDRFADIPSSVELPVGDYTVVAKSGDLTDAAFDSPYYEGEASFSIQSGNTTSATVTCTMANVKVSVVYSDDITTNYDSYSTAVDNGTATLTFDMNENRSGYFSVATLNVNVSLEKNGTTTTKTVQIETNANEHHTLNIKSAENTSASAANITVESSVQSLVFND